MPVKKKPTKRSKKSDTVEVEIPTTQFVGKEDMLSLELSEVKLRNLQLNADVSALQWQALVLQRKQTVQLEHRAIQRAKADRQELTVEVGTRYNVDLTKCGLDPESGALTFIDE